MDVLFLLVPITLVFLGVAIWGLFWSIRSGQYDDLDSPAHKILFDDDDHMMPKSKPKHSDQDDSFDP